MRSRNSNYSTATFSFLQCNLRTPICHQRNVGWGRCVYIKEESTARICSTRNEKTEAIDRLSDDCLVVTFCISDLNINYAAVVAIRCLVNARFCQVFHIDRSTVVDT